MNGCASICTRDTRKQNATTTRAARHHNVKSYIVLGIPTGAYFGPFRDFSYDIVNKQPRRALSVRLGAVRYDSISDSIPHGVILTFLRRRAIPRLTNLLLTARRRSCQSLLQPTGVAAPFRLSRRRPQHVHARCPAHATRSDMSSATVEAAQVDVENKKAEVVDLSSIPYWTRLMEVARAFLPMGFVAFGGPQAHIALFLKTFVEGRKWLDEQRFMELMSLGQAMPGPTSTQMATAMGISRAGVLGGMVSFWLFDWVGFAIQLGVGTAIHHFGRSASSQALSTYKMAMLGMGPAAISQVYLAAYGLGIKAVGADKVKILLALGTMATALLITTAQVAAYVFLGCIAAGGLVTALDSKRPSRKSAYAAALKPPVDNGVLKRIGIPRPVGLLLAVLALLIFLISQILIYLPAGTFGASSGGAPSGDRYFAIFASLYKMGISIYGGGQVVLPLLEEEFVSRTGYANTTVGGSLGTQPVDPETFGFGLALAQSMPGPLFNFSAFLGAVAASAPGGILGFLGLFGPGILLIYAFMPFWEAARQHASVRTMLVGMNAASIGLVFAACVTLFQKYCRNSAEAMCMVLAGVLAHFFKVRHHDGGGTSPSLSPCASPSPSPSPPPSLSLSLSLSANHPPCKRAGATAGRHLRKRRRLPWALLPRSARREWRLVSRGALRRVSAAGLQPLLIAQGLLLGGRGMLSRKGRGRYAS
jgi:chromate transporter